MFLPDPDNIGVEDENKFWVSVKKRKKDSKVTPELIDPLN